MTEPKITNETDYLNRLDRCMKILRKAKTPPEIWDEGNFLYAKTAAQIIINRLKKLLAQEGKK